MPLKHTTESTLILVLALVTAATGLLGSTLPPLPEGGMPWAILVALVVLYPLALTPLFKARRADTALRWMHWFPVLMLLLWFVIEATALYEVSTARLQTYYSVAWMLPAVVVGFFMLMTYCLRVMRRRTQRVSLLLCVLVLFAALGIASARGKQWEGALAVALWRGDWWQIFGTGAAIPAQYATVADRTPSAPILEKSSDASEEEWRQKMRASERRSERAAERRSEVVMEDGMEKAASKSASSAPEWKQASSKPSALPSSGGPFEVLLLTSVALYTGVLHDRSRKRVRCV
jgi:hypothetical protein